MNVEDEKNSYSSSQESDSDYSKDFDSDKSCLFVNNIDPKISFNHLFDIFQKFGRITLVKFNEKHTNKPKYAFIRYENPKEGNNLCILVK